MTRIKKKKIFVSLKTQTLMIDRVIDILIQL